jgi:hypothetical protein
MFHSLMKYLCNHMVFMCLSDLGYLIYLLQATLSGYTARINVQCLQDVAALLNYLLSRWTGPTVSLVVRCNSALRSDRLCHGHNNH